MVAMTLSDSTSINEIIAWKSQKAPTSVRSWFYSLLPTSSQPPMAVQSLGSERVR